MVWPRVTTTVMELQAALKILQTRLSDLKFDHQDVTTDLQLKLALINNVVGIRPRELGTSTVFDELVMLGDLIKPGPGRDELFTLLLETIKDPLIKDIEKTIDPGKHKADILKTLSSDLKQIVDEGLRDQVFGGNFEQRCWIPCYKC